MIGISKERLMQIANQTHDSDDTNMAVLSLLDMLINKCQELNQWLPIDEYFNSPNEGGRLVNIGKWTGVNFKWIYVAFLVGNEWHLPFDSERDEFGTPILGADDIPTHYQELPPDPE